MPKKKSDLQIDKKVKSKRKIRVLDVVMVLALLIGIGVLSYPFIQDALNDYLDQQVINYYQHKANTQNEVAMKTAEEKMKEKNAELAKKGSSPGVDAFSKAVSDSNAKKTPKKASKTYFQKHTIAVINIPKISVNLPVFDVTNDLTLQKGAALLEGTSYPIGGASTHAVISAHRGLSTANLFTDLPKLKIGDKFYIDINKERHAYKVEKIQTILPTNTAPLKIQPGRDLVTLMTCTPYMVNTHRLLVTGHRVPYTKKEAKAMKKVAWWKAHKIFLWLAGAIAALALLGAWLWHRMLLASIAKKRLDVFFKVLDQDSQKPVKGATFAVMNKAGKKPIHRDGKPIVLTSDDEGNVKIEKLRGGVYQIVPQDLTRASRFTISLKHPKRGQFDFIFVKKFLGKHVLNEDKIEEISYQGLADLLKKKGAN